MVQKNMRFLMELYSSFIKNIQNDANVCVQMSKFVNESDYFTSKMLNEIKNGKVFDIIYFKEKATEDNFDNVTNYGKLFQNLKMTLKPELVKKVKEVMGSYIRDLKEVLNVVKQKMENDELHVVFVGGLASNEVLK